MILTARASAVARQLVGPSVWALMLGVAATRAAGAQGRFLGGAGAEFVGVGASRLATGALDDRLAARDYPTFGRAALALSLGGYRVMWGAATLGAEWHGVIQGEEVRAGRIVGFGGGYGTVGVGYAVQLSPRARVYPRVGVGVGGLGVWFERPEQAVGFDDVLGDPDRPRETSADPDRETVLSRNSMVLDLGAGAELLSRGPRRGPLVGVRLGYVATPFTGDWWLRERPVSGGPAASLAGPYVRLVLGTGRSR